MTIEEMINHLKSIQESYPENSTAYAALEMVTQTTLIKNEAIQAGRGIERMKIYIAGSITNNDNYIEQFKTAEKILTAQGHAVINPVKNEGFTYKEYIDMGLNQLMQCDSIYMLKGYEDSTGAMLEYTYAVAVGLNIIFEE